MAHGATRRIRRHARRNWMDLRGLDKRQQRRRVREDARELAEFQAARGLMPGLMFAIPSLDPEGLRPYLMGQAVAMPVLANSRGPFVVANVP